MIFDLMGKGKTWKRELAFLMFLHLVYVASFSVNVVVLQILIIPYMAFMLAAFGLDTAVKQMGFTFKDANVSK